MNLRDPDTRGELLSAYLDGELTPEETQLLEQFLATSPEGRAELAGLKQITQRLHALPRAAAPDDLLEQVQTSVVATPKLPVVLRYQRVLAVAAAIASLGLLIRFSLPATTGGERGPLASVQAPLPVPAPAPAEAIEDAAQLGTEMKRLQSLGYVGSQVAAVEEADVADNEEKVMLGQAPLVAAVPIEPAARGAGAAGQMARGRQQARADASAEGELGYEADAALGRPATLRLSVQTRDEAQFERLEAWSQGLDLQTQAGPRPLSPEAVADVLGVLASEDQADVSVQLEFRGADIENMRRAFARQQPGFVPEPPNEVQRRKRPGNLHGFRAAPPPKRVILGLQAVDPEKVVVWKALQQLLEVDLTTLTVRPRRSDEPPARIGVELQILPPEAP